MSRGGRDKWIEEKVKKAEKEEEEGREQEGKGRDGKQAEHR
jgi:hypothetical protein